MGKVLKTVLVSTAVGVGTGALSYLGYKCIKLTGENARLKGENEELKRNSKILIGEVGKANYHLGRTVSEKITVKK